MLRASVIIPTYNRKESLRDTLNSLAQQSYPIERYEVIIVDDGSTDGTEVELGQKKYPFTLRYFRQTNQGSAMARNTGAQQAQGDILIFLDDDIWVEQDYITGLVEEHQAYPRIVGMGSELPYIPPKPTAFALLAARNVAASNTAAPKGAFVNFTHCITNNLSVERVDFFEIGMMQDVAGDGPTWWGDVDFGYRAHQMGFQFRRSGKAKCYHRDHSTYNLATASKRYYHSARIAVLLFNKYPGLRPYLPMFNDKTPITWSHDSPGLVVRKLARRLASMQWVIGAMEKMVSVLERCYPTPALLAPICRWIVGGYIFQGYRAGLREYSSES